MDLFELAIRQLQREDKKLVWKNILSYTIKIRRWMDKHPKASDHILRGSEFKTAQQQYKFRKKYEQVSIRG